MKNKIMVYLVEKKMNVLFFYKIGSVIFILELLHIYVDIYACQSICIYVCESVIRGRSCGRIMVGRNENSDSSSNRKRG